MHTILNAILNIILCALPASLEVCIECNTVPAESSSDANSGVSKYSRRAALITPVDSLAEAFTLTFTYKESEDISLFQYQ